MKWYSPLVYLWTLPNTLLGLWAMPIVYLQGGSVRIVDGVVEISGGSVAKILSLKFLPIRPCAITLGHVVWAIDQQSMNRSRTHERVHVRQYERWGPLFIPAYLGSSLYLWWRGRDAYMDNPFEFEAYNVNPD